MYFIGNTRVLLNSRWTLRRPIRGQTFYGGSRATTAVRYNNNNNNNVCIVCRRYYYYYIVHIINIYVRGRIVFTGAMRSGEKCTDNNRLAMGGGMEGPVFVRPTNKSDGFEGESRVNMRVRPAVRRSWFRPEKPDRMTWETSGIPRNIDGFQVYFGNVIRTNIAYLPTHTALNHRRAHGGCRVCLGTPDILQSGL